jgi:hypothetical protein
MDPSEALVLPGHESLGTSTGIISMNRSISTRVILRRMLIDSLDQLTEFGARFELVEDESARAPGVRADAIVDIAIGDAAARFLVEERQRAPYMNEIGRLRGLQEIFAKQGVPLLSVPFVSEPLGNALTQAGWSWADEQGNFDLRASGLVLRQRRTFSSPKVKSRQLPQGAGGLGIVRTLIRMQEYDRQSMTLASLATKAQVSQPRVSQVLRQLEKQDFLHRSDRHDWSVDRASLLDQFLAEYKGPGGSDRYFYTLDSPSEFVVRLDKQRDIRTYAVSADVGPDLIVLIIGPKDRSVFPDPQFLGEQTGSEIPLADPAQMIWDLRHLGGADRLEAADQLREWLVSRR